MKQAVDLGVQYQNCYSFGDIDAAYFEEQAEAVMAKLEGEEDIAFSIAAIGDASQCEDAFEAIPVEDREDFLETCREADASVSFSSSGQEFILIKTDKEFLLEEPTALRGLLAHELMHTVQRDDDLGQRIEDAAKRHEDEMIGTLREAGVSDPEINRFIHTVFQTAIFTLKDLFTNRDLINQGFVEELEAYYHHMLGMDSFCPAPGFYGEEASVAEIQDALTFELGLLPAWLPFQALERDRLEAIRQRIEECYEEDIPRVAEYVHALEDLYAEEMDDPEAFMDAYFSQLIDHAASLMEDVNQ
ncbi:MAG: hypothetical protein SVW02_03530 [Candidatus Nanohaloarchaea archaeon]|nr:hypothetical protein [Candidatus Nanohaloarchaea archaeon]